MSLHQSQGDSMVAADHRHRGVGVKLVHLARRGAEQAGCEWLHVDFEAASEHFYVQACGFTPTRAGLLHL